MTTAALFCFGNFMKKEGRSGTAGDGSWRILLSRSVAEGEAGRRRMRAGGTGVEGENEMMEGGGRERKWERGGVVA